MNKKETKKYLEESARLFKALRFSGINLKELIENGPNREWIKKQYNIKGEDQNDK